MKENKSWLQTKTEDNTYTIRGEKGQTEKLKCNKNKCQCNINKSEIFDNNCKIRDLVQDILRKNCWVEPGFIAIPTSCVYA